MEGVFNSEFFDVKLYTSNGMFTFLQNAVRLRTCLITEPRSSCIDPDQSTNRTIPWFLASGIDTNLLKISSLYL